MKLSPEVFRAQFDRLSERLRSATGESFEGFDRGTPFEWEGYKGRLRERARERMALAAWRGDEIGSGEILERAIAGIEITRSQGDPANNLTRWEGRFGHANRSHARLIEARESPEERRAVEAALYAHFCAEAPPEATFAQLSDLAGARYDLLAYLFFVRDWDRFMPIATRTFDRAFAQFGLDLVMSYNASWENYQGYNGGLGLIRDALREMPGLSQARLVDAHSFCWLLVRPELERAGEAPRVRPGRHRGRSLGGRETSIWEMADGVEHTVKYANGQVVETTRKEKLLLMSRVQLEENIKALLDRQQDRCALTGIPLQFHGTEADKALLPSLDRIDSAGHYSLGNLQVVCRFINGWKSSGADDEFRRLLTLVREGADGP